jgi:hypothetical protein
VTKELSLPGSNAVGPRKGLARYLFGEGRFLPFKESQYVKTHWRFCFYKKLIGND